MQFYLHQNHTSRVFKLASAVEELNGMGINAILFFGEVFAYIKQAEHSVRVQTSEEGWKVQILGKDNIEIKETMNFEFYCYAVIND